MNSYRFRVHAAPSFDCPVLDVSSTQLDAFLNLIGIQDRTGEGGIMKQGKLPEFLLKIVELLPPDGHIAEERTLQKTHITDTDRVTEYYSRLDKEVYCYLRQLLLVVATCIKHRRALVWSYKIEGVYL